MAADLPGDMTMITMDAAQPCWCSRARGSRPDSGVDVDTKWGGSRTFFSGKGLFLLRCTGQGDVLVAAYGGILAETLAPGESYTLDTGFVVAFDESVQFSVHKAGNWKTTVLGGEGLVTRVHRSRAPVDADPEPERPDRLDHPAVAAVQERQLTAARAVRRPFLVTLISFLMIGTGILQVLFGVVFFANRNDEKFLQDAAVGSSELIKVAVVLVAVGAVSVLLAFSLLRGSRVARALVTVVLLGEIVGGIYTITEVEGSHRAAGISAIVGAIVVLCFLFGTQKARAFFA